MARFSAHGITIMAKRTTVALLAVSCVLVSRVASARDFPPFAPAPAPVEVPAPAIRTLANGLQVLALSRAHVPAITLMLAIRSGAECDPQDLPGTAQFVASMLGEGTANMRAEQIEEQIDGMGAVFDSSADWDDSWASLTFFKGQAPQGFKLLAAIVTQATFRKAETERIRRQTLSALAVLKRDPGYVADTLVQREIFWGTPYSHPMNGDEDSIRRLTGKEIDRFYRRYYQPSNAMLAVVGDLSAGEAFSLATKYFGNWKNDGEAFRAPQPVSQPQPRRRARVVVVDDPQAVQTEIRVANLAVRRDSPAYDALTIENQVLGGPAENWLFTVLRTRRGLVYGASSSLVSYRTAGAWEIKTSTKTAATRSAVSLILREMKRLDSHPLTAQELADAQDYLVGHMALQFQSSQQIAERELNLLIYNLPLNTWNRKAASIRAQTLGGVSQATREYLNPSRAVIVLVGNAAEFKKSLTGLGRVQVIPMADADLGSPTLEQPASSIVARKRSRPAEQGQ